MKKNGVYGLGLLWAAGIAGAAGAGVRFTDIPDQFVSAENPDQSITLDLDQDGLVDVEIAASFWGMTATPREGCAVGRGEISISAWSAPFGAAIDGAARWIESNAVMYGLWGMGGNINTFGDHYPIRDEFLAVRLGSGGSARYGWVCVRVWNSGYDQWSIASGQARFFAIEEEPGVAIAAGVFPCSGDCDGNGVCDEQEIAYRGEFDSNANGVLDACEPAAVHRVPEDFGTIQEAVNACRLMGDEVVVGPGRYEETVSIGGRSISLHSSAGAERTVVTCPIGSDGFAPMGASLPAADLGAALSRVEGFTLSGGLFGVVGSVDLRNCRVIGNTWGGVDLFDSRVESCVIAGNGYDGGDGGVGFVGGTMFVNCLLIGNRGESGIVYNSMFSSLATSFTNCTFIANHASTTFGWHLPMRNSIMRGNTGYCNLEFSSANHCTVDGPDPKFVRMPSGGADGVWGTEDDDYGDLRLSEGSPFLNAGQNSLIPAGVTTDAAGRARVAGNAVDLGAFEGPACIGDLDLNGLVDDADFVRFATAYDLLVVPLAESRADFNGDKQVDDADFVTFAVWYDRLVCP